jgi:phosphoserine phosphatase
VERVAESYDIDLSRSFAYSDSVADEPLLEAVGNPVVVNPKAPFRAIAERRGWEIVEWHERAKGALPHDAAEEWGSWAG